MPESLEVGNGAFEHIPLLAGGDVLIVDGAQTGSHIDLSGYAAGFAGALVTITPWVERVDDGSTFGSVGLPGFVQLAGWDPVLGSGWFAGERASVPLDGVDVCLAQGTEVRVCASVGTLVSDGSEPEEYVESCVEGVIVVEPSVAALCVP